MRRSYYVYISANKRNGTLYIGVTNDLARRMQEHKMKLIEGFTKKYGVAKLVYFEEYNDINEALKREKQLKKWNRKWKLELIEKLNPEWNDLITGFPLPAFARTSFAGMTMREAGMTNKCLRLHVTCYMLHDVWPKIITKF